MSNWRPIRGWSNDYEISSIGAVQRVTPGRGTWPGRVLKTREDSKGYLYVHLPGKRIAKIHRLVAEAWCPNPHGYSLVRHLDGDSKNNDFCNLAWGTAQENSNDRIAHGNSRGSWTERSHCAQGHEYREGSYVMKVRRDSQYRQCLKCRRAEQQRRADRQRAAQP